MINIKVYIPALVIISMLFVGCEKPIRNLYPKNLEGGFELLAPDSTGIDFNNKINEHVDFNHFYFSQIYSGAGVAIGDINNDNLPDVFFCGNQVSDRLYLNMGDFKFKDITKKSRAAVNSGWSWGVTMADVNNDGYLDIYVSRNGESMNPEDRKNQLYINNQDLTFKESAMAYGLADAGFSTQAVFFDMDNDGDLDMYQVNQPADSKLFLRHEIGPNNYGFFSDKLYRNDNGRYKDVSIEVGISNSYSSYGLSVSVSDFNNDGWADLYVANDYGEPDFMYYNDGDGTFTNVINEKMNHISQLSMGSDSGDINNDGFMDIITIDMTSDDHYRSKTNMQSMDTKLFNEMVENGKHHQYMSNTLQVNTGVDGFYDVANMVGIARTDWSWASLLVDLDNDSWKDIIISNGIKKDVLNNDYITVIKNLDENITAEEFYKLTEQAPSIPLSNYAFKNNGNLGFTKVSKEWGFDTPSFSSGMAYADLDNDGDLDVIINNMEAPAFVYRNEATGNFFKIDFKGSEKNKFAYGAKAIIHHNGKVQTAYNTVTRGYFSSVEPGLFFGLGKDTHIDSIKVIWPDGKTSAYKDKSANTTILADYGKAQYIPKKLQSKETLLTEVTNLGVNYVHQENRFDEYQEEVLLPHNISQNGPFTAVADINGDGLEDLFVGGAKGQSGMLYIQTTDGLFLINESQPWQKDKDSEDLGCLFVDVDQDGDQDLYVASGGSEMSQGNILLKDRLYINNGVGGYAKNNTAIPNIYESTQCVKSADIDNDGDLDLFVGTRLIARKYGYPASSFFLINEKGNFSKIKNGLAPDLESIGMVTDATFTDIDNDGDQDLIVVGEWMEITVLENVDGTYKNSSEKFGVKGTNGLWWSITASDLDGDGDDDYIVGNLGKNNKFKASKEHPFKVYANDFDNNGTNDIVLAKYYKNDYVPVRGKECTSQQMPFVSEKFKDYHSFASSKLVDILPEDKVSEAVMYEVSNFESVILINENGKLISIPLPIQAQITPLKSCLVDDFNKDGYTDILTVGNHFGVEVETTRYDAGFGALFLGDESTNFNYVPPTESGFLIKKDTRSMNSIRIDNKELIVVSSNNEALSFFVKK